MNFLRWNEIMFEVDALPDSEKQRVVVIELPSGEQFIGTSFQCREGDVVLVVEERPQVVALA